MNHHKTHLAMTAAIVSAALLLALALGVIYTPGAGAQAALPKAAQTASLQPQAGEWVIEEIDFSPSLERGRRSLAIDSYGQPHVVYGGNRLFYTRYSGGTWHQYVADASWGTGKYASIALDSQDGPNIAYYDQNNGDLKYTYELGGSGWYTATVDSAGDVGKYSSIDLDVHNRAHIAYLDATNGTLKYAYDDSSTPQVDFSTEVVATNVSEVGDLLLDQYGHPHIVYLSTFQTAMYAYYNGSGWTTDLLNAPTDGAPRLALDTTDHPHIAFQETVVDPNWITTVHIQYYDGVNWVEEANWSTDTLLAVPDVEFSIAIDAANALHVSTPRMEGGCVAYIKNPGLSANPECIQPARYGQFTSLALGADGQPRILYLDNDDVAKGSLYYTAGTCAATCTWNTSLAAEQLGDIQDTSLDLDGYKPYIGYARGDRFDGQYSVWSARRQGDTWQRTRIDTVGGFNYSISLGEAVDPQGHPYLSYGDGAGDILKYAYLEGGDNWPVGTADPNDYGLNISMAINSQGRPRISYRVDADPSDKLMYAAYNGSGWDIESLDTEGHPQETSLALDSAGHPHIAYSKNGASIHHAWHDGTQWHFETIESRPPSYVYIGAIALDAQDRPQISYVFGEELHYAYYDGTQWHIEMVDSGGISGKSSLAIYPSGAPAISYQDPAGNGLKFAARICFLNVCNWYTQILDATDGVGHYNSMKIAPDGSVHISYSDGINRAVRYIHYDVPPKKLYLPLMTK